MKDEKEKNDSPHLVMTVAEIAEKRDFYGTRINDLIHEFEKSTGLHVLYVIRPDDDPKNFKIVIEQFI